MGSPFPPEPVTAPRPEPPVAPARPRWRRRVLIGVAVVVALAVALAAAAYGYARWRFDQVPKVHVPALSSGGSSNAVNVLVVGSDSRAVSGNDAKAFGSTKDVAGQRADVIKIVHLVPGKGVARVLSIPRDLLVTVPGQGRMKINFAFDKGPDPLVRAVQNVTGVRIDHFVLINFEGFQGVVNALGGVHMYFPTPARDKFTGLNITSPGCKLLNGRDALAVSRSRHYYYQQNGVWKYDGTSDFGRIIRQNAFLRAVIKSAHGVGLLHPLKLNRFLGEAVDQVVVDDTWGLGEMVDLGRHYRGLDPDALADYTFPTTEANGYGSFGDVLLPDQAADKKVLAQFLAAPAATPSPAPKPSGKPAPQPSGSAPAPAPSPSSNIPAFDPRPC